MPVFLYFKQFKYFRQLFIFHWAHASPYGNYKFLTVKRYFTWKRPREELRLLKWHHLSTERCWPCRKAKHKLVKYLAVIGQNFSSTLFWSTSNKIWSLMFMVLWCGITLLVKTVGRRWITFSRTLECSHIMATLFFHSITSHQTTNQRLRDQSLSKHEEIVTLQTLMLIVTWIKC